MKRSRECDGTLEVLKFAGVGDKMDKFGGKAVDDAGEVEDDGGDGVVGGGGDDAGAKGVDRRKGLTSIIENLKVLRTLKDKTAMPFPGSIFFGDTSSEVENATTPISNKPLRRRRPERPERMPSNGAATATTMPIATTAADYHNNNHVKNERLSPGTPDTSSRSITPSSASHPNTPPASEVGNPLLHLTGRNYSDFMRSLAAKYNNANPNEYFSRNGFPPPLDPRFKTGGFPMLPALATPAAKDEHAKKLPPGAGEFQPLLGPFVGATPMFPPLIDMSSTQALLAMVRTAKEAELQGLLKTVKRAEAASPLDLSAAAGPPNTPPMKRPRIKTPSVGSAGSTGAPKRAESESPKLLHEDISHWSVEDVCNFVQSIDICAEYAQNFKDQRIDGSGLPLLTEEHLTTTMNMKLGPALKLKSILAKKLGSCNVCLHCSHCHLGGADAGNASSSSATDSGANC